MKVGVQSMRQGSRVRLAARVVFLLVCCPGGLKDGAAQQAPDARKILRESADACRAVSSIEYVEEQEPSAEGGAHRHTVRATVRQVRAGVRAAGFLPGKFAVEGAVNHADGEAAP